MNRICPTPTQLSALLRGEDVEIFVEDERIHGATSFAQLAGEMYRFYDDEDSWRLFAPHYIGEVLWCGEEIFTNDEGDSNWYRVDGSPVAAFNNDDEALEPTLGHWVNCHGEDVLPAAHMPQEAARVFVKVTGVGVDVKQTYESTLTNTCAREVIEHVWSIAVTPIEKPQEVSE